MNTIDFIAPLFRWVDDTLTQQTQKQTQAKLCSSAVVTIALLSALKVIGSRAFYR